jgi:Family of unknown function (DUF6159)
MSRGWRLTKESLAVVRMDGSLLAITVLGLLAALFVALAFLIPAALFWDQENEVVAVVVLLVGAYLTSFAAVFFGVALAAAASEVLEGRDATVASALAVARSRLWVIALWALAIATVNVILRAIQDRAGPLGDVIAGLAGVAWSLTTLFVVPIIALEGLGPREALKKSATVFRQRWGEGVTGQAAVGAIFFIVGVLPAILIGVLGFAAGDAAVRWILVVVAVAIGVAAIVVMRAVSGVFGVALYRYATGASTGPFATDDLERAVGRRRKLSLT